MGTPSGRELESFSPGRSEGARNELGQPQKLIDRERLLALINSLPEDVFFVNADGNVELVNDAVCASLGLADKTEVYKRLAEAESRFEVYGPDGRRRPPGKSPFGAALRGEAVRGEEVVRNLTTGELRHREYQVTPVRAAGQTIGAVSVVRDVTERKRAEQQLLDERRRMGWVLDTTGIGLWFNQLPFGALNWDARTRELFFVPEDVAPTIDLFWARLHPEDREPTRLAVEAAIRGHALYTIDHRAVHPQTGEVRWIRSAGRASYDEAGTPLRFDGINYDITARKAAEEALAQGQQTFGELVERAPFGMYIVDAAFRIAYMNAGSRTGAFRNVQPVIGRPFNEAMHILWPDAVAEEIIGHFRHTLETGEPYFSPRFVNRRADVEVVEAYEWELHRMMLPDGRYGVVCYYFDSTQIRAAEAELRRLANDLREADRRKDEFLAVLSHELRNPLAPIRNSVAVLGRAEPGGEQAKRACAVIDRQAAHLTRLVDDLLDATRIARGKMQIRCEPLELGELVRRAVEDHRAAFAEARVELKASVSTRPAWVSGDATRLSQAIGNLLHNAAKFTPAGGHVEASLWVADGAAMFRVVDTGMGMAPEILERIFEPFAQGEQALDRRFGGLGLGLALAKTVVEHHGGGIKAASDGPGRGATFTVRLPLETPEQRAGKATPAAPPRPRRVLVIEDHVDAADSLRAVLELGGHIVTVAHRGPEGIEVARELLPEVVLCDIGLPGMDGYAVARAFRADETLRSAFLVALTGYAQPEDIAKAIEAGFDRHLAKPADPAALERALDTGAPDASPRGRG